MCIRDRVGTGAHHRNGGFAAGLRHHVLHRTHQKIRGEHPAQTGCDDPVSYTHLFASNIYRVQQIIDLAVEDGRKVPSGMCI